MKGNEIILHQIQFLRQCQADSKADAIAYANAKNLLENDEARAGVAIIDGNYIDEHGQEIKLTNDIARKAFKQEQALNASFAVNLAKEAKDTSAKKVLVEISVLSALKQISKDEDIEDEILAKYDILGEEDNE